MLRLSSFIKKYESKARTIAEIAPWLAVVGPSALLNKDGSLMAVYEFKGTDSDGIEQSHIDRLAHVAEHALRNLDQRHTIWWTVVRRRTTSYPHADMPDFVSGLIDTQRRNRFQAGWNFENRHYFSVTQAPSKGAERFFDKFHYFTAEAGMPALAAFKETLMSSFSNARAFQWSESEMNQQVLAFAETSEAVQGTLPDAGLRRLPESEMLGMLHDLISPASASQDVAVPSIPVYLDSYLADNTITVGPNFLRFDGEESKFATACSIKSWPDLTTPGLMDTLLAVPGEITLSIAFKVASREQAIAHVTQRQKFHLNLSKPLRARLMELFSGEASQMVDPGRAMLVESAGQALSEITAQNRQFGYFNITVVAYGSTLKESEETLKNVMAQVRQSQFISVRETLHLLSAWSSTLPGGWAELVRTHMVSSANLADLAPLRTITTGERINEHYTEQLGKRCDALAVFDTEMATPYYFNFHVGALGHSFVVGPSGAGKSVLMNFLLSMARKYGPINTYIFDKNSSCRISTLLQGGDCIDIASETEPVTLNPMSLLGDPTAHSWVQKWIENLITSREYKLKGTDDDAITQAIKHCFELGPVHWRLRSLYNYLPDVLQDELKAWVNDGQHARFFDNETDSFNLGVFACFEMSGIYNDERLSRAFMDYAFYRIEKKLKAANGQPTIIYVEEAWFLLKDERFSLKVEDWLKTMRKLNGIVILTTQSLDDFAKSQIFASISDNIPTRIFLPNDKAHAFAEMYRSMFGLNDAQINRIRWAQPKSHYYIVKPGISRMVLADFDPVTLACLRSDQRALKVFERHYAGQAPNWQRDYIEEVSGQAVEAPSGG